MTNVTEGPSLGSGKTIGEIGLVLETIGGEWRVVKRGRAPHICASRGGNARSYATTRAFGSCFRPRFLNLMGLSVNEVTHHAPKATRGSSSNQVARTVTSPFGKLGVYVLRVEP